MTEKIPENSDATESPDDLQVTTFTCGECGTEFETAQALADHTYECDNIEFEFDDDGE